MPTRQTGPEPQQAHPAGSDGDRVVLAADDLDALVRWAAIGLEHGLEAAEDLEIAHAGREVRERGAGLTVDGLHAARRRVRASADAARRAIVALTGGDGPGPLEDDITYGNTESSAESSAETGGGKRNAEESSDEASYEAVVEAVCRTCEGDVDPLTMQHAENDLCVHEIVPEGALEVWLACPRCERAALAEVNVGEVHDEVVEVTVRGGALVLVVDQSAWMDRHGAGWVCTACDTPLRLPQWTETGVVYV